MKKLLSVFVSFNLVFLQTTFIKAACPNILTKSRWSSHPNNDDTDSIQTPVENVIIAHTTSQECNTLTVCSRKLNNLEDHYINNYHNDGIGYNFIIGGDGNIYEGVGWHKEGEHAPSWNSRGLIVAFIGNFGEKLPTHLALEALRMLLACGVELGELDTRYKLIGHRQIRATQSPGARLFQEISTWPHFTVNLED